MNKLVTILLVIFLSSCSSKKALYSWANYDATSYNYNKNRDEKSVTKLIDTYNKVIDKQKGSRGCVPPGIYADYGFLLIQNNKIEEGEKMISKEISLYPESKIFLEKILKMIEND
jgi:hypothetical protein